MSGVSRRKRFDRQTHKGPAQIELPDSSRHDCVMNLAARVLLTRIGDGEWIRDYPEVVGTLEVDPTVEIPEDVVIRLHYGGEEPYTLSLEADPRQRGRYFVEGR